MRGSKSKSSQTSNPVPLDYGSFPSIPTIILIDKKGNLARQVSTNERTVETMSAMIEDLLK